MTRAKQCSGLDQLVATDPMTFRDKDQFVQSGSDTHRRASMLAVMPGLVRPDFLIEIEAYAAAPNEANGTKD